MWSLECQHHNYQLGAFRNPSTAPQNLWGVDPAKGFHAHTRYMILTVLSLRTTGHNAVTVFLLPGQFSLDHKAFKILSPLLKFPIPTILCFSRWLTMQARLGWNIGNNSFSFSQYSQLDHLLGLLSWVPLCFPKGVPLLLFKPGGPFHHVWEFIPSAKPPRLGWISCPLSPACSISPSLLARFSVYECGQPPKKQTNKKKQQLQSSSFGSTFLKTLTLFQLAIIKVLELGKTKLMPVGSNSTWHDYSFWLNTSCI